MNGKVLRRAIGCRIRVLGSETTCGSPGWHQPMRTNIGLVTYASNPWS